LLGGGGGEGAFSDDGGGSPALARETSISSCVRFLDWRKAVRLSRVEAATEGSWRTVTGKLQRLHEDAEQSGSSQDTYRRSQ